MKTRGMGKERYGQKGFIMESLAEVKRRRKRTEQETKEGERRRNLSIQPGQMSEEEEYFRKKRWESLEATTKTYLSSPKFVSNLTSLSMNESKANIEATTFEGRPVTGVSSEKHDAFHEEQE